MQSEYPAAFTREQGFTEAEWQRCLPGAVGAFALSLPAPGQARVAIGAGQLQLHWQVLPPRRIALLQMPRLVVAYRFDRVEPAQRQAFMKYFDLVMQRGGG